MVGETEIPSAENRVYFLNSQKFTGKTKINVAGFSHGSTKSIPSRAASRGAVAQQKVPSNRSPENQNTPLQHRGRSVVRV